MQLPRFAVYDAFGAKYEMIKQDVVQTQGLVSSWPDFDRAIEALSTTLNPVKSREANKRKALTIKDLLIKVCNSQEDSSQLTPHSPFSVSHDTNCSSPSSRD